MRRVGNVGRAGHRGYDLVVGLSAGRLAGLFLGLPSSGRGFPRTREIFLLFSILASNGTTHFLLDSSCPVLLYNMTMEVPDSSYSFCCNISWSTVGSRQWGHEHENRQVNL